LNELITEDETSNLLKLEFLSTSPIVQQGVNIDVSSSVDLQEKVTLLCHSPQLASIVNEEFLVAETVIELDSTPTLEVSSNGNLKNDGGLQQERTHEGNKDTGDGGEELLENLLSDVDNLKKERDNTTKWVSAMSNTIPG